MVKALQSFAHQAVEFYIIDPQNAFTFGTAQTRFAPLPAAPHCLCTRTAPSRMRARPPCRRGVLHTAIAKSGVCHFAFSRLADGCINSIAAKSFIGLVGSKHACCCLQLRPLLIIPDNLQRNLHKYAIRCGRCSYAPSCTRRATSSDVLADFSVRFYSTFYHLSFSALLLLYICGRFCFFAHLCARKGATAGGRADEQDRAFNPGLLAAVLTIW